MKSEFKEKTYSAKTPKPMGAYPVSKKAGELLFLSGIGPRSAIDETISGLATDKYGNYIHFDFEAQVHAVFHNLKIALEESQASWQNIVDVTVFLVNMKRDFVAFNKLYSEYFKENQPCRTTIEVTALPSPIAIELKVIAYIGKNGN